MRDNFVLCAYSTTTMFFPVAGIEASPFLPPLAAFAVSLLTSMGGVSGAFLLLPFQVSVLGYTSPSVSATNQFFNVVATPGGVWRYYREGRLFSPLARILLVGCVPGVVLGAFIRLHWLADAARFKLFAAMVLLMLAWRLARDLRTAHRRVPAPGLATPTVLERNSRRVRFAFQGQEYAYNVRSVLLFTIAIGIVGGVYGMGGGSILAPLLVSLYGLPVHVTSGPTLLCTWATSVIGVAAYMFLAPFYPQLGVAPDWALGLLMGVGGLLGMYLGARLQKYVPAKPIKILLTLIIIATALAWIVPYIG